MKWIVTLAVSVAASMVAQTERPGLLSVTSVRHWSEPGITRVAVEISGDFQFTTDRLHGPERVYYDIPDAYPFVESNPVYVERIGDKLVKRIRIAENRPHVTRVVLDLAGSVEATASKLSGPNRLVIEVRNSAEGAAPAPPPVSAPSSRAPAPSPAIAPSSGAPAPSPAIALSSGTPAPPAASPPSPGAATAGALQILELLDSLAKYDRDGRNPGQKIGFEFPERALNEYLAYSLHQRPRPGVCAMSVSLLPNNDISAVVEIDFSSVSQWVPEMVPEPLRPLLSGKRVIRVNAHFESGNGSFTFTLKDVYGPDDKLLANTIVTDLLRVIGSHQPESYNAAAPISLPFGLKRIWTEKQALLGGT